MQLNEVELKSKLKDGSIDVKQIINLIHDLNRKKSPWETNVDIEDKELINLIIDKGFKGCRTEMDTVIGTISSFMLSEIYEERTRNFSQEYKEKIDEISNNIGMFPILTDISLGLFDQRLLNTVNPISIARLYRYVFLSHNTNDNYFQFKYNKDYEKLFEYEKISNFMIIYGDILEQDIQKIDIVNFLRLFDKYSSNVEFFNELLSNGRLTDEEYIKIKHYFFAPSECNIELKTRQDLDNVDEYIKEFINSSNFLCGGSTEFFQKIVGKQFFIEQLYRLNRNPNSLEKLVRSLNLSDGDEETIFLGDIKRLLNLCKEFDKLEFNETESEELRKQITEVYIGDIPKLYSLFFDCKQKIMNMYGKELQANLTNIDNLTENNQSEFIEDYEGTGVNYVIVRDPCVLIQHTMNAYEKNYESATLEIFSEKYIRDIWGMPIISTCVINNRTEEYLEASKKVGAYGKHEIESENDVVLLFDTISSRSLGAFGVGDCQIQAGCNKIETVSDWMGGESIDFDTVNSHIKRCEEQGEIASEYVFLFEDENGNCIKPSGVRVIGDEPSIYEIRAAQRLGVPLIKLEMAENFIDSVTQNLDYTYEQEMLDRNCSPEVKKILDGIREIIQIKAQKRTSITREGIRSMSTNQNLGYRDILSGMEELLDIYQNPEELDYDTFNLDD